LKILICLLLPLTLFSQEVLKKKDDKVMISSVDLELEQGKKYIIQSDSGEAEIGVYKNRSGGNYVAKVLSGDLNVGDRINSFARKSSTTTSVSESISSSSSHMYEKYNFGIHLGANYSGGTNTSFAGVQVEKHDSGLGFQGGLVFDYNFNSSMTLAMKLSFNVYENTSTEGAVLIGGAGSELETRATTISVQPRFKYKFLSNSKGHKFAYGFLGARIGRALSMTGTITNPSTPTTPIRIDYLDENDPIVLASQIEAEKTLFDIPLGIGMNFKLNTSANSLIISPNFTYYLQVKDLIRGAAPGDGFRVTTMEFNLDILF